MDCRKCQELLIKYLDGTLPKAETQALQAHLAGCPACQREEAALIAVFREVRTPLPEPSELFWINFLPRVRERISSCQEPWTITLLKPAVSWGTFSLANPDASGQSLLIWRLFPNHHGHTALSIQTDYLTYVTGYRLVDLLAQAVETSEIKIEAKWKVFEKLSPKDQQDRGLQVQEGNSEDLDNLLEGLTPEQRKTLEEKLQKELRS